MYIPFHCSDIMQILKKKKKKEIVKYSRWLCSSLNFPLSRLSDDDKKKRSILFYSRRGSLIFVKSIHSASNLNRVVKLDSSFVFSTTKKSVCVPVVRMYLTYLLPVLKYMYSCCGDSLLLCPFLTKVSIASENIFFAFSVLHVLRYGLPK